MQFSHRGGSNQGYIGRPHDFNFKNHVNGHSKHFGEYEEEVNIETCTTILHEDKKEQALRGYVKL